MIYKNTIPEIDLSLLESNRDKLLAELKHALIDYGFFFISNYGGYLDQNILTALNQEVESFFSLSHAEKEQIKIAQSKHFLGYSALGHENAGSQVDLREQIDFGSIDSGMKAENLYDNLVGPNQYPSEEKLPFFKKSIKDFFRALNQLSILITRAIFDTLKIKDTEANEYINFKDQQNNFSGMKAMHYPSRKVLNGMGENASDQRCPTHTDSGFLTFRFQPALEEGSIQVQSLLGEWITVTPRPNTIFCNVGQTLEYLTSGVCISNIHKAIVPQRPSRISIEFFQNVKLNSTLKPFKLSPSLLNERDEREKLRKQTVDFQFKPIIGEPVAKSLFYSKVKAHPDVAARWYPEILKSIDTGLKTKEEGTANRKYVARLDLQAHLERVKKVFKAIDNVLIINILNHTADLKLHSILPQIRIITGLNLGMTDILQVAYIWPDFAKLKLDATNDIVVDTDYAKDTLALSMVDKRIAIFEQKLIDWFESNQNKWYEIPALDKSSIYNGAVSSKTFKRQKKEILQKHTKRPKIDKSSNLSLLQRIKKREKHRLENQISREDKYDVYLFDKLGQLLEILSSLRPDQPHSVRELTERIVSSLSLTNALAENEAIDLISKLSQEFPTDFVLFTGRNASVLRWKEFSVNELKDRLRKRLINERLIHTN